MKIIVLLHTVKYRFEVITDLEISGAVFNDSSDWTSRGRGEFKKSGNAEFYEAAKEKCQFYPATGATSAILRNISSIAFLCTGNGLSICNSTSLPFLGNVALYDGSLSIWREACVAGKSREVRFLSPIAVHNLQTKCRYGES
jgi:hypothetical protein